MKKLIAGSLLFVLTGASIAFAASSNKCVGDSLACSMESQVVALSELSKDAVEDFFKGRLPQVILECTHGSILPFNLSLKGEFLALELEENISCSIKIMKTCFIKGEGDTFLFSTDLQDWKDFLEFFTGEIGVSLHIDEGVPSIDLNLELNRKT